jgi:hypothetical protein
MNCSLLWSLRFQLNCPASGQTTLTYRTIRRNPRDTRPRDTRREGSRWEDTRLEGTRPKGTPPKDTRPKDTRPKDTRREDSRREDSRLEGSRPGDNHLENGHREDGHRRVHARSKQPKQLSQVKVGRGQKSGVAAARKIAELSTYRLSERATAIL